MHERAINKNQRFKRFFFECKMAWLHFGITTIFCCIHLHIKFVKQKFSENRQFKNWSKLIKNIRLVTNNFRISLGIAGISTSDRNSHCMQTILNNEDKSSLTKKLIQQGYFLDVSNPNFSSKYDTPILSLHCS